MGKFNIKQITSHDTKTLNMVRTAFMAVLITVCSWITIPGQVPFTLQTFAVFTALGLLGGKLGTASICIYILLGCAGVPVFSGFRGGFGVIAGATGGYIYGFILAGLVYWGITSILKYFIRGRISDTVISCFAMILGNAACYAAGTAHYVLIFTGRGGVSIGAALAMCVIPFIIPDLAKIAAAVFITRFSGLSRRFEGNQNRHQA